MACTTILVGNKASYDGSCMIARNDDTGAGTYSPKKLIVVQPDEQPRLYKSVISHVEIPLPDDPMRYTSMPSVDLSKGIWAAAGINSAGVSMTATETITSNPRVLGADPLVVYDPKTGTPGGIGEEDLVVITLPYIRSAKEGVLRLGELSEQYGTYEMNGIAFADAKDIWWFESIGGHNWMAKRVAANEYVVMPNQLGIDSFDFEDAAGEQINYMCSAGLPELVKKAHLDLSMNGVFNPRDAFGSADDSDHVYNTPRAWYMLKRLNPHAANWDSDDPDHNPQSDSLPWSMVPEKKITVEEVKYLLSSHYQGTRFDPYMNYGDRSDAGKFRPIGINRTAFLSVSQLREDGDPVEWIAFASNAFNVLIPFYTDVNKMPEYVSNTTMEVSTDNFYWVSRLIAAMADASYNHSLIFIERYQESVFASAHRILNKYDALLKENANESEEVRTELRQAANQEVADMAKAASAKVLDQVLYQLSNQMKNSYARSDA